MKRTVKLALLFFALVAALWTLTSKHRRVEEFCDELVVGADIKTIEVVGRKHGIPLESTRTFPDRPDMFISAGFGLSFVESGCHVQHDGRKIVSKGWASL
jgi:hypothetical protein